MTRPPDHRLPALLHVITVGSAVASLALGLWALRFNARLDTEMARAARGQSEVLARDFAEEFAVQHREASARIFETIALRARWTQGVLDTILDRAHKSAACRCRPAYLATGAFLWESTRPSLVHTKSIAASVTSGLRDEIAARAAAMPTIGPLAAAGVPVSLQQWPAGSAILLLRSDGDSRAIFGVGLFQRLTDGTLRAAGFVGNTDHPWIGFLPGVVEKVASARLGPRHAELASWRVVRPGGDTLFAAGQLVAGAPLIEHRFLRQQFVSDSNPQLLGFLSPATATTPAVRPAGTDPGHASWHVVTQVSPEAIARVLYGSQHFGLLVVALLVTLSALLAVSMFVVSRRLVRHAAEREAFATAVAHDLRTPLTQILLHAESLHLGRAAEGTRREAARVISREARRLVHLVENAMTFVRRTGSPPRLTFSATDLSNTIELVVANFAPMLARAEMQLRTQLTPGLCASLDTDAFMQVLVNLLENAVRFGPRGQVITVSTARVGGEVSIAVADQGPGIPAAEREHVFAPFARGRASGGTGIGLAVARQLVELMNGRISVRDPLAERGALLEIRFPLSNANGAPVARGAVSDPQPQAPQRAGSDAAGRQPA